ncbi:MAG: methyltransferase domain-containing protein [Thermodesulfobacteriota bacterium]
MVKKPTINRTRQRYDRLAPFYDLFESVMETWRFASWRARLTESIRGPRALEAGVGTGKNIRFYPEGVDITGIDFSHRMLRRARRRAEKTGLEMVLTEMDVQQLDFPDQSFDTVFATFVFCSVPDPVQGLMELRRICKPDGRLLLLEHMRPDNHFLGRLFDFLAPLVVRITGANINRNTMGNIRRAGWNIEIEEHLSGDIVRWIEARP